MKVRYKCECCDQLIVVDVPHNEPDFELDVPDRTDIEILLNV